MIEPEERRIASLPVRLDDGQPLLLSLGRVQLDEHRPVLHVVTTLATPTMKMMNHDLAEPVQVIEVKPFFYTPFVLN